MAHKFNYKKTSQGGNYNQGTGYTTVANHRKDQLNEKTGYSALCTVRKDAICDKTGYTVLCTVRGDNICDKSGYSVIVKISKDVKAAIKDCQGSNMDVAFWYKFCK